MEYDLEPKQAWRLADRLLHNVVFEAGIEEKNEWIYASSESDQHKEKFRTWIEEKQIKEEENIWVLISHPADETKEMKWNEFINRWEEFLSDTSIRVTNKAFTWLLEYKPERVARFGRKIDNK